MQDDLVAALDSLLDQNQKTALSLDQSQFDPTPCLEIESDLARVQERLFQIEDSNGGYIDMENVSSFKE